MKSTFSKNQLKKVGEKLRHGSRLSAAEEAILADFRIGHRNIIESFRNHHNTILKKTKWKDRGVLFASRLKKRQTIIHKLSIRQHQMDLSRMNDIAGCRLIFLSLADLLSYRNRFVERLKLNKHFTRLYEDDRYNYISKPRDTGYRGIHDVYEEVSSDSIKAKIEVQYRTIAQHSWATALEIWDQSHLNGAKFGLEDSDVQQMFCLYAELLWRFTDWSNTYWNNQVGQREKINLSDEELYGAICSMEQRLNILDELSKIKRVQTRISLRSDDILLQRYATENSLRNNVFLEARQLSWDMVNSELFVNELNDAGDLVFVQASPKILRRAYNNYFDDTKGFVKRIRTAMRKLYERRKFARFRRPLDPIFVQP